MRKLEGKIAVVTGASKGIGAGIAKQLASEGAAVVVNYSSSREGADQTVQEIAKAGGKAVAVGGDVSKKADVEKLFAETKKIFGTLDILVNNAGVFTFAPLGEITEEHFHHIFNINVLGVLLATQEAIKLFPETGGSVINIGSVVSTFAPPGTVVYSATKGAIDTITRGLSKELGSRKIRVNSVAPGMVDTEGTKTAGMSEESNAMRQDYIAKAPLGRIGKPKDIATVVSFLASEDASWVTGETWFVSGGGLR